MSPGAHDVQPYSRIAWNTNTTGGDFSNKQNMLLRAIERCQSNRFFLYYYMCRVSYFW